MSETRGGQRYYNTGDKILEGKTEMTEELLYEKIKELEAANIDLREEARLFRIKIQEALR